MEKICCICGQPIEGFGNNPYPINDSEDARCCDLCNISVVLPARLEALIRKEKEEEV